MSLPFCGYLIPRIPRMAACSFPGAGQLLSQSGDDAPYELVGAEPQQLYADREPEPVAPIIFTPSEAAGQWRLDDDYIDPFARR